jgi:isopentenyl-diphosphate delta-isomerase
MRIAATASRGGRVGSVIGFGLCSFAVIENVVLVDETDGALGTGEKLDVHRSGALHRAFSVFAFNAEGELLMQRRAWGKYHSGGLWTNTACGHPRPGEPTEDAARRRLFEEMGVSGNSFAPAGRLRYRAVIADLVENELDHLFVTSVSSEPVPDPSEVVEWRFVGLSELASWLRERPGDFTAWFPPAWEIVSARAPSGRA